MKTRFLYLIAGIAGCVGAVAGIVMVVMAARFMELGRFVFYMCLAFVCVGFAVWGFCNGISKKD